MQYQYDRKFYIESYGCAMNFADSEVVASILNEGSLAGRKVKLAENYFKITVPRFFKRAISICFKA